MKTTKQMVSDLRAIQLQIINGKNTFSEIADLLENQEAVCASLLAALKELYAMVQGECPSLLNEDSGGSARVDMQITEAIAKAEGQT